MRLLREEIDPQNFEIITEAKEGKKSLFIKGPMIVAEQKNANGRRYLQHIIEREVAKFQKRISVNRAAGELNHPQSPEINPERISHYITELKQDKNIWIGTAKVSSAPMGQLLGALIEDGYRVGMSTRGLGSVGKNGIVDENYNLITIDSVNEPSGPGCFVDPILEAREWEIREDGTIVEKKNVITAKAKFQDKLNNMPTKDRETYLWAAINEFMRDL